MPVGSRQDRASGNVASKARPGKSRHAVDELIQYRALPPAPTTQEPAGCFVVVLVSVLQEQYGEHGLMIRPKRAIRPNGVI